MSPGARCDRCIEGRPVTRTVKCWLGCEHDLCEPCAATTEAEAAAESAHPPWVPAGWPRTPGQHPSVAAQPGDATHDLVNAGQAYPLCVECATDLLPRAGITQPHRSVHDHLRSEGPH